MAFLINIGDKFKINPSINPDGSVILAGNIPINQLERKKFAQYPLLESRYFDPQLYLTGLDPNQTPRYCSRLATYPWFGVSDIEKYDSDEHHQNTWLQEIEKRIVKLWNRSPLDPKRDGKQIQEVARDCVDFQIRIGCKGIILPSPLTHDSNTDYITELFWLDSALDYIQRRNDVEVPVFATVALTDNCLTYSDPFDNQLVEIILDTIGAREIDGVYMVVEQRNEADNTRNISHARVLWSALHLAYLFKQGAAKLVGVNFFGPFGLVLEAVGADFWASGWYKSRYRLRLADKVAEGRAMPSCWSNRALVDIHLDQDFDTLWSAGLILDRIERTEAAQSLLDGVASGRPVQQIPSWRYGMGNITAAQDHFLQSACIAEQEHSKFSGTERLDYVENEWLVPALEESQLIQEVVGANGKTHTQHVQAWLDAFRLFRRDHNL